MTSNEHPQPGPGFWYMAGPYSDNPDKQYEQHLDACYHLTRINLTIYSPIVHWHPLSVLYEMPGDADSWLVHDFTMIDASKGMILLQLPGWKQSNGVKKEVLHCQMRDLPVWGLGPPKSNGLILNWTRLA